MPYFGNPQGHYRPENLDPFDGRATMHGFSGGPSVLFRQYSNTTPVYQAFVSDHQEDTCACVPRWAIENDQTSTLQTWLTNDAAQVDRPILLDLLKTCVYRDKKVMAQMILKVDISLPLDVSIVLRDCVRYMRRPQILKKAMSLNFFLEKGLNPDLELTKRDLRTGRYLKQPAALLCAACMRSDTIVLEALIKAGADMRVFKEPAQRCLPGQDSWNLGLFEPTEWTPMSVAALTPNLSCLKFLLDNKRTTVRLNDAQCSARYVAWMIGRGYMGTATALVQALECAEPDLVQLLLHGADPHERDGADQDAYDYAGGESSRLAMLVEGVMLRRRMAAGDDDTAEGGQDTAGGGESSLQATVMVEGDTPLDVESV
ncbi:hypothetical protein MY3296_004786 [Beauveria thailandica]